jgi:hypothetical protein
VEHFEEALTEALYSREAHAALHARLCVPLCDDAERDTKPAPPADVRAAAPGTKGGATHSRARVCCADVSPSFAHAQVVRIDNRPLNLRREGDAPTRVDDDDDEL